MGEGPGLGRTMELPVVHVGGASTVKDMVTLTLAETVVGQLQSTKIG